MSASALDTVLAVYTGSDVTALTEVAGSDDADNLHTSRASFDAVDAAVYYVQVGSYNGNSVGAIALAWHLNTVANDGFAHRSTISGATGSINGSNAGATLDLGEPSGYLLLDASVWYSWTPAADGDVTLTLSSGSSGWVAAYTGAAVGALGALVQRSGSSPVTDRFRATAGTTYAIQVGTSGDELPGSFALGWSLVGVPGSPTLNAATPGDASVALAWSAPSSIGGGAVTGYKVYRGTSTGGETLLTTLANVTAFNDTTVAERGDVLVPGDRAELARRGHAFERALGDADRRAAAAHARSREREQRPRDDRLGSPARERRLRDHGLQGLPRHVATAARRRSTTLGVVNNYTDAVSERHDLLLQGLGDQRARREREVERALGDADARHRAGRADARRPDRGQRDGVARVECARLRRRRDDHGLQDLPRHVERRRGAGSTTVGAVTGYTDNSVSNDDDVLLQGRPR